MVCESEVRGFASFSSSAKRRQEVYLGGVNGDGERNAREESEGRRS